MKKRWSAIVKRTVAIALVMLLVLSSVPVTAFAATTMTLYYNGNGGTATSSSKKVTNGSTYGSLASASRTGYTFSGWWTSASGGSRIYSSTKVTKTYSHTVYAHWTAKSYTVSFNANGGSCGTASKTVKYASTYSILPTPTRTGYTFAGWYTSASGGTKINTTTTMNKAYNHTLYAHWTANKYTVTLDPNGGYLMGSTSTRTLGSIAYGSTYSSLSSIPTPTRSGYSFAGWYTASSGGSYVSSGATMNRTANHTLYAHWSGNTYTVSFDANGGSCGTSSMSVKCGSTYGTLPTATRTGYTFAGWYNSAGTRKYATSTVPAGDHTLTAKWTANSYTVTFNANGGSCSTTSKSVTYKSTYGTLPTPTRTGYTFAGWYTAASGGTKITSSSTYSTASGRTLYAHWTLNSYTITLKQSGGRMMGSTDDFTFTVSYGEKLAFLSSIQNPLKSGYTFQGWYTAETGGTYVNADTTMTYTSDITLYAHWSAAKVVFTLDAGEGTCADTSFVATYGEAFGSLPVATRTGYSFQGWYDSNGNKITSTTTVTQVGGTLTAGWTASSYTVIFDANGGTCSPSSKTVTYASVYGEMPVPTRDGYTFEGWYTAQTGGSLVSGGTMVSTVGMRTLYAHWTANSYTITLKQCGGRMMGSTEDYTFTVKYGEKYTVLSSIQTPTQTGCTFQGWYTAETGGTYVNAASVHDTAGNVTLYAQWTYALSPVVLNGAGGQFSVDGTVVDGVDVTSATVIIAYKDVFDLPVPTRIGYTFDGWFDTSGNQVTSGMVNNYPGTVELTAKWTGILITVHLDSNNHDIFGGILHTDSVTLRYGDSYAVLDQVPYYVCDGYSFAGFYTAKVGGTQVKVTDTVTTLTDHTLYARWSGSVMLAMYDLNLDASEIELVDIAKEYTPHKYLGTYNLLIPTHENREFLGWFREDGTEIINGETVTEKTSFTAIAYWGEIDSKVNIDVSNRCYGESYPYLNTAYTAEADCGGVGQSEVFYVESNGEWFIEKCPEWLNVSVTKATKTTNGYEGNATVTLTANRRNVECAMLSDEFIIRAVGGTSEWHCNLRMPYAGILFMNGENYEVTSRGPEANDYKLNFVAGSAWRAELYDHNNYYEWFTIGGNLAGAATHGPGTTNGCESVGIHLEENNGAESRVGYLVISTVDDRFKAVFTVNQSGKVGPIAEDLVYEYRNGYYKYVPHNAGTYSFKAQSKFGNMEIDIKYEQGGEDWLTCSYKKSDVETCEPFDVTLTYTENTNLLEPRVALVTFTSRGDKYAYQSSFRIAQEAAIGSSSETLDENTEALQVGLQVFFDLTQTEVDVFDLFAGEGDEIGSAAYFYFYDWAKEMLQVENDSMGDMLLEYGLKGEFNDLIEMCTDIGKQSLQGVPFERIYADFASSFTIWLLGEGIDTMLGGIPVSQLIEWADEGMVELGWKDQTLQEDFSDTILQIHAGLDGSYQSMIYENNNEMEYGASYMPYYKDDGIQYVAIVNGTGDYEYTDYTVEEYQAMLNSNV